MKKVYVPICPKCGNLNLSIGNILSPSQSFLIHNVGIAVLNEKTCRKCGYTGICPEVQKDEVKHFRNHLKK